MHHFILPGTYVFWGFFHMLWALKQSLQGSTTLENFATHPTLKMIIRLQKDEFLPNYQCHLDFINHLFSQALGAFLVIEIHTETWFCLLCRQKEMWKYWSTIMSFAVRVQLTCLHPEWSSCWNRMDQTGESSWPVDMPRVTDVLPIWTGCPRFIFAQGKQISTGYLRERK